MPSNPSSLTVLLPEEGESWNALARRTRETPGDLLLVLSGPDERLGRSKDDTDEFVKACTEVAARLRIATKHPVVAAAARRKGLRVIDRTTDLRRVLARHPRYEEAMRSFAPWLWQQQLRSRLQTMGLLSLPKIRVYLLILVSAILFFFVLFWLLPSAEIQVRPREDTVSQTANIFLVQSGATVDIPVRVRTMELRPIRVEVEYSFTFDQISKEFIGESATVNMTVINKSSDQYSLRRDTRVLNQAGMIFRLLDPVDIGPGEELVVRAVAADTDLYGEIIGERGNLPEGLKWDFPGLAPSERILVYAENRVASRGGRTSYRTVLHEGDIAVARKRLEQELLARARQLVAEEVALYNAGRPRGRLKLLEYDELTTTEYTDFVLPTGFLGEAVTSIPVEGKVIHTAYAYDNMEVLDLLSTELRQHVGTGRRLLEGTLTMERLVSHVIDYTVDLSWIKLTVDLSGTEQYILDPLTPNGARFAKNVREMVTGSTVEDAIRILRNLPEVSNVNISVWPPWNRSLPHIPSHISIEPVDHESFQ